MVHILIPLGLQMIYADVVLYYFIICRQKLRRVEVELIKYREYLEEQGTKSSEEIEREVESRRRRLLSDCGMLDMNEDDSGRSK